MIKTGVIGATGYAGQQLVSLLVNHPEAEVTFVSSNSYAGQLFSDIYPQFYQVLDQELLSTEPVSYTHRFACHHHIFARGFRCEIIVVISFVGIETAVVDLKYFFCHTVEKITIVRNHKDGAFIFDQKIPVSYTHLSARWKTEDIIRRSCWRLRSPGTWIY